MFITVVVEGGIIQEVRAKSDHKEAVKLADRHAANLHPHEDDVRVFRATLDGPSEEIYSAPMPGQT